MHRSRLPVTSFQKRGDEFARFAAIAIAKTVCAQRIVIAAAAVVCDLFYRDCDDSQISQDSANSSDSHRKFLHFANLGRMI